MKATTCKTCQNQFEGNFCNRCGEKVLKKEDLTARKVLEDLLNAFTFADNKLWRTLRTIIGTPGRFSISYMKGKRVPFMKPISIFFLANLLYFIYPVFNTFNTSLEVQQRGFNHLYSGTVKKMVERRLKDENDELSYEKKFEIFKTKYNAKTTELSKLLLIFMAGFLFLFYWILHPEKSNRIVGHFVVSLESMVFVILFCMQLLGLTFALLAYLLSYSGREDLLSSIVFSIALLLFFWRVERNFYHTRILRSILNTIFVFVGFIFSLYLYRAFLFFMTFYSI